MVWRQDARTPPGLRLYAIGDVHGCRDTLASLLGRIEGDVAERPPADWRIVMLGDLIDRGPDSRGVIEDLSSRAAEQPRLLSVLGNHDFYMLDFLSDPLTENFDGWTSWGGRATVESYGLDPDRMAPYGPEAQLKALSRDLRDAVPAGHTDWLESLPRSLVFGDYLFVHAGVRPGIPLEAQAPRDLIWIREPFLSSDLDHGHIVVHGHTPVDEVQVRRNRIGIDTGHVWGGPLSCLVLEDNSRALLEPGGLVTLD